MVPLSAPLGRLGDWPVGQSFNRFLGAIPLEDCKQESHNKARGGASQTKCYSIDYSTRRGLDR